MQTNHATTKNAPRPWRPVIVRLLVLLPLAALGFSWPRLVAGRADAVERIYAEGLYPWIVNAISAVTARFPFSVAEFLLYGLVLLAAIVLLSGLVRLLRRRLPLPVYLRNVLSLLLAAAVLLNLFYATWGLNYLRTPLSGRMGLPVRARAVDELEALVSYLADEARTRRSSLLEGENGVFRYENGLLPMLDSLPDAYASLSQAYPVFAGKAVRAKRVCYAEGLSHLGISGIYVGFTAEPNINAHQPDLLLAAAAAHEMAHGLGIASENEAEFTAYLACMASDDPAVQYSGVVSALMTAGNALHAAAPERYSALRETYGEAISRDFADYSAYWRRYEGKLAESADRVNDNYLKFNAQESGIKSYGESVDLLLAYYDLTNR